jgi:hypothetical protein
MVILVRVVWIKIQCVAGSDLQILAKVKTFVTANETKCPIMVDFVKHTLIKSKYGLSIVQKESNLDICGSLV